MGMIRNHYVGRTFIQPTQAIRDFSVRVKSESRKAPAEGQAGSHRRRFHYPEARCRNRIRNLRQIGQPREVHMAVSCPPTRYPCPYGIDFSSRGELIAAEKGRVEDIARFIGLDSLHYLSLAKWSIFATKTNSKGYCLACYSGDYPLPPARRAQ